MIGRFECRRDALTIRGHVYRAKEGKLPAVAAGTGRMNFDAVARFIREKKPGVQMTLENTKPDNAVQARKFVEGLLTE